VECDISLAYISLLPPADPEDVVPVDTGWDGVRLCVMGVLVSFFNDGVDNSSSRDDDGTGEVEDVRLLGREGALFFCIFDVSAALLPVSACRGRPLFFLTFPPLDDKLEALAADGADDIVPPSSQPPRSPPSLFS